MSAIRNWRSLQGWCERQMCFNAEVPCLNTGGRWCRSWISGQFTSVLFDLDQALLLQLPLKPSRNLVKLYSLLKGAVIQIHCRTKCQIQYPTFGHPFHGKEFRPLFWVPLFHAQCLNSGVTMSCLHTHKLYLPCRMLRQLVTLTYSELTLERLAKNNHPLFLFCHTFPALVKRNT